MKLQNLETLLLLPKFMREDNANIALAAAWDNIIRAIAPRVKLLAAWDSIDSLTEAELDEMAWEINILWYLPSANIQTKRRIIREADLVASSLGTKYAIQEVIEAYFGIGNVQEWYEYGGEPFHFRIYTSNPTVDTTRQAEFLYILDIVKRRTAILDDIIMAMVTDFALTPAVGYHETAFDRMTID